MRYVETVKIARRSKKYATDGIVPRLIDHGAIWPDEW